MLLRLYTICLAAGALLGLSGCAERAVVSDGQLISPEAFAGLRGIELPELPLDGPAPPPRGRSVVERIELRADEFLDGTPELIAPDGRVALPGSGAGSLRWLLYRFADVPPLDHPLALTLELDGTDELPADYFVALSNYARGYWQWQRIAAPTTADTLTVPLGRDMLSGAGHAYCLVASGADSLALRGLSLSLRLGAPPPVDLRAGDGTSDSAIELSWTDPAYTYADDPGFAYDAVAVLRAPDAAGPWTELALVPAGETAYADADAAAAGPPGTRLYYRLSTRRDGHGGPPGLADSGYLGAAPVAALEISQDGADAPVTASFDAGASHDPDGGALRYRWDWDRDGVIDLDSGTDPTVMRRFETYGPALGRLTVTDDEGSAAVHDFAVGYRGWVKRFEVPNTSVSLEVPLAAGASAVIGARGSQPVEEDVYFIGLTDYGGINAARSFRFNDEELRLHAYEASTDGEDIYVLGVGRSGSNPSYSGVARLSLAGELLWLRLWRPSESYGYTDEDGSDLTLDEDGNVLVTGYLDGETNAGPLLLKLSADGELLEAQVWTGSATNYLHSGAYAVCAGPQGVFLGGSYTRYSEAEEDFVGYGLVIGRPQAELGWSIIYEENGIGDLALEEGGGEQLLATGHRVLYGIDPLTGAVTRAERFGYSDMMILGQERANVVWLADRSSLNTYIYRLYLPDGSRTDSWYAAANPRVFGLTFEENTAYLLTAAQTEPIYVWQEVPGENRDAYAVQAQAVEGAWLDRTGEFIAPDFTEVPLDVHEDGSIARHVMQFLPQY